MGYREVGGERAFGPCSLAVNVLWKGYLCVCRSVCGIRFSYNTKGRPTGFCSWEGDSELQIKNNSSLGIILPQRVEDFWVLALASIYPLRLIQAFPFLESFPLPQTTHSRHASLQRVQCRLRLRANGCLFCLLVCLPFSIDYDLSTDHQDSLISLFQINP